MNYYIAYGSNLNPVQMKQRCPNSKVACKSILKDYELVFNLYLTVEPCKGKECPVVIYEITEDDEDTLDICEGVHRKIYRKEYIDMDVNGFKKRCLIYIMNNVPDRMGVNPTARYISVCEAGYDHHGFDKRYLHEAKN